MESLDRKGLETLRIGTCECYHPDSLSRSQIHREFFLLGDFCRPCLPNDINLDGSRILQCVLDFFGDVAGQLK